MKRHNYKARYKNEIIRVLGLKRKESYSKKNITILKSVGTHY